jgi:thiamine pyrophosphokinase
VRLCADGGANRVYDALPAAVRDSVLPSALIGDFDSIRPAVLAAYKQRGVGVHHDADQNSTDLQKALHHLRASTASPLSLPPFVVVYAAFGGRFDQQVANMHTLHSHCSLFPVSRLLLLSEGNMLTALPAAVSRHWLLRPHPQYERRGGHCGLFALGAVVKAVTTRGLKWDIAGWDVGWGSCMSTNNVIDADEIEILMDGDDAQQHTEQLLWTTEFQQTREERGGGEQCSAP